MAFGARRKIGLKLHHKGCFKMKQHEISCIFDCKKQDRTYFRNKQTFFDFICLGTEII